MIIPIFPHGVVLYPTSDDVGAFYNPFAYENLPKQLNGEYAMRVYEVNSQLELVRALNKARHKYGLIDTAVIGGHGYAQGIQLGINEQSGITEVSTTDLQRSGAQALQKAFVERPTIILASCSTGELGGIGQQISTLGTNGAEVVAPDVPTQVKEINAVKDERGKFHFEVEYVAEGSKVAYMSGEAKDT